MTGFNLPPGCTTADIDRAMGLDTPCDVCGRFPEECICPECPYCSEYGNPKCYDVGHELKSKGQVQTIRLERNAEQIMGRAALEDRIRQEEEDWSRYAAEFDEEDV